MLWAVGIGLLCYLIGAIPFPVIVSRYAKGIDLRQHGSGNMGAANAGRVLGKRWFVAVFLLDFVKGAAAAYVARQLLPAYVGVDALLAAAIGAALAVVGHCFPIYVGFKGGLGLAASAGALAIISPWLIVTVGGSILIFWTLSRNMYVGTAAAVALGPVYAHLLMGRWDVTVTVGLWAALIVILHMKDVRAWWAQRRAK
ncbi:MAG: acyl-phosphate glycerol 3-phosphate acyltransferase [Symbiobacteriaceae bacterium]|jgi:glycerol-3-phosphate acyltransferase PlsY|nr:acyl-phosphate glycerol 3-phosphate acyltransferase [Symbiobacteriaceae bacterium]